MTENITRNEIAETIFNELGLSKNECIVIVDEIINSLSVAIINDGMMKIPGFGTFKLRFKKERQGRNPKTKEPAIISSRNVILFKISQQLKNQLNDK
tara:strand:- start:197 stop:487 length:291 start_codon:yes stop_codon:yes gene_type:complete